MENQNNNSQPLKKSNTTKLVLIGLGLLTTGVVSVFSYQHWKKNKAGKTTINKSIPDKNGAEQGATVPGNIKDRIKAAFKTIHNKTKKTAVTKSPAETANAKTSTAKHKAAKQIAHTLQQAATEKNFKKVSDLLKTIKSPEEYSSVNKVFSLSGLKPSITSKLESTFHTEEQRQVLQAAFTAMGLKFNGKKWALAGLTDNPLLITTRPTQVWKNPDTAVPVPEKMVLGKEVAQRGNYTLFENDHQYFLVQTLHTKHYTTT